MSARSPIQRTVAQLSASKRPRTPDSLQSLPTLRLSLRGVISRCAPKYTSTHSRGVAYFCHICAVAPPLKQNCPVGMVIKFWRRGHFCAPHCPVFNPISPAPALSAYLGYIACRPGPNPQNPFKPHSLRTSGHTCNTGARHEPGPARLSRSSSHSPLLPPLSTFRTIHPRPPRPRSPPSDAQTISTLTFALLYNYAMCTAIAELYIS